MALAIQDASRRWLDELVGILEVECDRSREQDACARRPPSCFWPWNLTPSCRPSSDAAAVERGIIRVRSLVDDGTSDYARRQTLRARIRSLPGEVLRAVSLARFRLPLPLRRREVTVRAVHAIDQLHRDWLDELANILDAESHRSREQDSYACLLLSLVREGVILACRSRNTRSLAVESAILRVRNLVDQEIASYARRCNRHTRMCSLPAELLSEVFHHLDLCGCVTASHVCKHWRSIALDTSSLWADVVSIDQAPGILTRRLERIPAGAPLRLMAIVKKPCNHEILDALRVRVPSLRSLWLRLDGPDDELASDIGMALSQPAPTLTHLELLCGATSEQMKLDRCHLLADRAPNLRNLKYYGTIEAIQNWPLASRLQSVLFSQPLTTTLSTLSSVFALFDNVETLGIEVDHWEAPTALNVTATHLQIPASLRTLAILLNDNDVDPRDLLSLIPHGPLLGLIVRCSTGRLADRTLITTVTDALQQPIYMVYVFPLSFDENEGVAAISLSENLRYFHVFLRANFTLLDTVQMFRSLTVIMFTEILLPEGSGPYEFASVTHLVIVLLEHAAQVTRGHDSLFLLAHAPTPLLICPALTHLMFMADPGTDTILSPDLVRLFIHWHVKCPTPLQQLDLMRVELLESNLPELITLLSLVQDIGPANSQSLWTFPKFAHLLNWGRDF